MKVNRIFSYPLLLGDNLPNNVQVDWSRKSRKQLSLLNLNLIKLSLLGEIENVMQKYPNLHKVVGNIDSQIKPNDCESDFCPLFKWLLVNAYQNANKIPTSRQHATIIKTFAISLLIYAGPMAYDLVHRTCQQPYLLFK